MKLFKWQYKIIILLFLLLLIGSITYILYPRFVSPIYSIGKNEYGMMRLVNGNEVYDEKWTAPKDLKAGRQIGRTIDGFTIFEVKGDKAHDSIVLTGFMFGRTLFVRHK